MHHIPSFREGIIIMHYYYIFLCLWSNDEFTDVPVRVGEVIIHWSLH